VTQPIDSGFLIPVNTDGPGGSGRVCLLIECISTRTYLAANAMQGLLASHGGNPNELKFAAVGLDAVRYADALIAALNAEAKP